jgi:hypothetical protein
MGKTDSSGNKKFLSEIRYCPLSWVKSCNLAPKLKNEWVRAAEFT